MAPPHEAGELNAIIVNIQIFSQCAFLLEGGAEEGDRNQGFTWSGDQGQKSPKRSEEDEVLSIPP